ncbi:MAG: ATP-dependent DNA helicase RecG [Patescibacteria group bacterium]
MTLHSPLTNVKGVGVELAKKFSILGIKTIGQLIDYYPRRYDDYSQVQLINQIRPGNVTIKAFIKQSSGRYARRGLHITEAAASDDTGSVRLIWFNQPYRAASIKSDQEYYISGDFSLKRQRLSIQNPSIELVSSFPVSTARIVPIYKETKGLTSTQIRKTIREVLPLIQDLPETLPKWLVQGLSLYSRSDAVEQIHFPSSQQDLLAAKKRLGFEEVFELTLAALLNKYELQQEHTVSIPFDEKLARSFVKHLPFHLTPDQKRVVWQIYQDMQRSQPMNRLIEGDVGSGKTVVAAMAALMAIKQGYQVALMAPTELLARQHAETVHKLLEPVAMAGEVGLLVGGLKPSQKHEAHKRIANGDIRFMIGTNALLQEKVDMHKLGFVIIDEQHRFGVDQRKKLQAKAGHMPHVLSMTATPIPRSLALTLYGELDISVIGSKPANRKQIKTDLITLNERSKVYEKIDVEISAGRQVFVVCPLISDSELMPAKSVEQIYAELTNGVFKHRRVSLLHGKLKPAQKDAIMQAFVKHELDILISTTVIEVGVDVPNATVMLIENPERFGLAQIHQLRGRVGRSEHQGYCYLLISDSQPPSPRLRALEHSSDGFKLAEYDLELRGPGAIYGTLQHGQLDLRIAKLTDTKLISEARHSAQEFIDKKENLLKYPELAARVKSARLVTNLN